MADSDFWEPLRTSDDPDAVEAAADRLQELALASLPNANKIAVRLAKEHILKRLLDSVEPRILAAGFAILATLGLKMNENEKQDVQPFLFKRFAGMIATGLSVPDPLVRGQAARAAWTLVNVIVTQSKPDTPLVRGRQQQLAIDSDILRRLVEIAKDPESPLEPEVLTQVLGAILAILEHNKKGLELAVQLGLHQALKPAFDIDQRGVISLAQQLLKQLVVLERAVGTNVGVTEAGYLPIMVKQLRSRWPELVAAHCETLVKYCYMKHDNCRRFIEADGMGQLLALLRNASPPPGHEIALRGACTVLTVLCIQNRYAQQKFFDLGGTAALAMTLRTNSVLLASVAVLALGTAAHSFAPNQRACAQQPGLISRLAELLEVRDIPKPHSIQLQQSVLRAIRDLCSPDTDPSAAAYSPAAVKAVQESFFRQGESHVPILQSLFRTLHEVELRVPTCDAIGFLVRLEPSYQEALMKDMALSRSQFSLLEGLLRVVNYCKSSEGAAGVAGGPNYDPATGVFRSSALEQLMAAATALWKAIENNDKVKNHMLTKHIKQDSGLLAAIAQGALQLYRTPEIQAYQQYAKNMIDLKSKLDTSQAVQRQQEAEKLKAQQAALLAQQQQQQRLAQQQQYYQLYGATAGAGAGAGVAAYGQGQPGAGAAAAGQQHGYAAMSQHAMFAQQQQQRHLAGHSHTAAAAAASGLPTAAAATPAGVGAGAAAGTGYVHYPSAGQQAQQQQQQHAAAAHYQQYRQHQVQAQAQHQAAQR